MSPGLRCTPSARRDRGSAPGSKLSDFLTGKIRAFSQMLPSFVASPVRGWRGRWIGDLGVGGTHEKPARHTQDACAYTPLTRPPDYVIGESRIERRRRSAFTASIVASHVYYCASRPHCGVTNSRFPGETLMFDASPIDVRRPSAADCAYDKGSHFSATPLVRHRYLLHFAGRIVSALQPPISLASRN